MDSNTVRGFIDRIKAYREAEQAALAEMRKHPDYRQHEDEILLEIIQHDEIAEAAEEAATAMLNDFDLRNAEEGIVRQAAPVPDEPLENLAGLALLSEAVKGAVIEIVTREAPTPSDPMCQDQRVILTFRAPEEPGSVPMADQFYHLLVAAKIAGEAG